MKIKLQQDFFPDKLNDFSISSSFNNNLKFLTKKSNKLK